MSYRTDHRAAGPDHRGRGGPDPPRRRLRAGIYLPHACCHGLCATCKVEVTDGEVDHGEASNFALMDYEREEGQCLACCATLADRDVTIEADIDDEPDAQNLPVQRLSPARSAASRT